MTNEIAIAHKDLDVYGGGEILAEELSRTFNAPLYVGHKNPSQHTDQDIDIQELAPESRWHHLMARGGALRGLGHMFHWRDNADQHLKDYSTVITTGNEPLWWPSRDHQTVIAYTHSPPRWLYDLHHNVDGFLTRTYQQLQRRAYEGRTLDPDLYVANSDLVAHRIHKYWNIPQSQIRVVYPPIPTHDYSPQDAETGDYYVTVSRLDNAKRIDEIVRAFNQLGDEYELRIAGKGPERNRLETLADSHIHFEGYVSDERKRELLAGARGFVFAALNEDFGMVPVESMAAGTPVIGVNEGFTQYQIMDGMNGYTFERDRDGHLRDTIQYYDRQGVDWSGDRISEFARRFSVEEFRSGMQAAVEDARERSRVEPDWLTDDSPLDSETEPPRPVRADGGDDT